MRRVCYFNINHVWNISCRDLTQCLALLRANLSHKSAFLFESLAARKKAEGTCASSLWQHASVLPGNSSALALAAAEPCALGNLAPAAPLRESDKKQWKTGAFMWLQIKILLCPSTPPAGTSASPYESSYTCVYLIYHKIEASHISRESFKSLFYNQRSIYI